MFSCMTRWKKLALLIRQMWGRSLDSVHTLWRRYANTVIPFGIVSGTVLTMKPVTLPAKCTVHICIKDILDIRFCLAGYPAVFYSPVADVAEMFNGTWYCSRMSHRTVSIMFSIYSMNVINLVSCKSFVSTNWHSNKHILCSTICNINNKSN